MLCNTKNVQQKVFTTTMNAMLTIFSATVLSNFFIIFCIYELNGRLTINGTFHLTSYF